jgi:hypothetical protein
VICVRKIELPKGRFADIAEEDDLTVQEQWDIEHAGIASESVSAHTTILQLEELRTLEAALPDAARTLEAELTAIVAAPKTGPVRRREAQERLKLMSDARATTALALAYQKLGPEEYAPIDRYEVVRVMCFLRSWDVPGPDGQPIPIPADRSPFAAVAPNSAMKVISAETVKTNTAPADFERSQEALLPKASATPTGGSSGSGSPAASRSAKGGTGRPTASRSTRARKSSSRRTGS